MFIFLSMLALFGSLFLISVRYTDAVMKKEDKRREKLRKKILKNY